MKKLVVMFAALGSLAAFGATSPKDAAQKSLDKVEAAFNAQDASKLSEVFSPDATLILPEGRAVHGRSAIQKEMTREFGKEFKDARSNFTLDGIRPVGNRAIWVDATHTLTNFTKPDGTKGPMKFHLTALLEKKGDQWLATEARPYTFQQPQTQGTGGSGK